MAGFVEKVTVSEVVVAAVTVPTAQSLKTTLLLAAVASKPVPVMEIVLAVAVRWLVLIVTVGAVIAVETVATCTAAPLLAVLFVTTAVRFPTAVGLVENVTLIVVAVAAVTVPTAPSLKTTVLCAATGSKPKPLITR